MDVRLNREIKAFCPDFAPARQVLRDIGADFVAVKEQVDYFYRLPAAADDGEGTRRLKLRFEGDKAQVIHYCDRRENGARTSRFRIWDVTGAELKEILDAALGVRAVVRKQRELWRKDNAIFNLDTVQGVGQVFEVEAQAWDGVDADAQVEEFQRLFGPCLGRPIHGSNEDLAPARLDSIGDTAAGAPIGGN